MQLEDPASKRTRAVYENLSASAVGLELGIAVLICTLVGHYLDEQAGTEPWLLLLFLALGLIAGFRNVLRAVRRADRAALAESEAARG